MLNDSSFISRHSIQRTLQADSFQELAEHLPEAVVGKINAMALDLRVSHGQGEEQA